MHANYPHFAWNFPNTGKNALEWDGRPALCCFDKVREWVGESVRVTGFQLGPVNPSFAGARSRARTRTIRGSASFREFGCISGTPKRSRQRDEFPALGQQCRYSVVLRNVPLYVRVDETLSISDRIDCFRPSDRLAGRDSHPLEIADFSRRTGFLGLRENGWLDWTSRN